MGTWVLINEMWYNIVSPAQWSDSRKEVAAGEVAACESLAAYQIRRLPSWQFATCGSMASQMSSRRWDLTVRPVAEMVKTET